MHGPGASTDVWASGDAYEPYVGRWSRLVAREFLTWLGVERGARWLDVGCGTGALTEAILTSADPSHVHGIDRSPAYAMFARRRTGARQASLVVADGQSIPARSGAVDVVVSGLALNFIPRPDVAAAEMARVVRDGGLVAAYVWDYAGGMQLMRHFWDAATALDPAAAVLDEGSRFPICQPPALEGLFRDAHLRGVETAAIDVPTRFSDFDDYWNPFLGGQGPAPSYVGRLGHEQRVALREHIRATLPIAADGSIGLVARAWGVRGTRRG
jgi:SAM-dependent methyltransferase